jgi:hypothetical protein
MSDTAFDRLGGPRTRQLLRNVLLTEVAFVGHGEFPDATAGVPQLASWAAEFRRRYVGALEDGRG